MISASVLRAGAAALVMLASQVGRAQEIVPGPTPNADALAAQMRLLGADPRNVYALIAAGELSTKLGDPAAALAFFGRAQAVDPGNMRIAAGKASALVLLERPGEALRLFDQAERAGVAMDPYLHQRGLAYDLIGQPGHAQRDYRRSLGFAPADETIRRLALSLAISGRRDEAMTLLDPLLRRSDRAAWRARACIMAIAGDSGGAQRIATSMIPGGAGLSPFFSRLQSLSPADRAFAVHFGEVTSNAARRDDARLAPALALLPAESVPLPSVGATALAERPAIKPDRRRVERRPGRAPIDVVAAGTTPVPPLVSSRPATPAAATVLAMRDPTPAPPAPFVPPPTPTPRVSEPKAADRPTALPDASPSIAVPKPAARSEPATSRIESWAMTADAPQPLAGPAAATPARVEPIVIDAPKTESPEPMVARRNTELLASIVRSISVPASELDVAPARTAAIAKAPEAKKPEPKRVEAKKLEPRKPDPAKAEPARWWVQVAGGANAADIGKDWKRLAAKSPVAFRGKSAWTTPLRATNRLLAGPFRTQAEATAFVNALAKDGSSAFAWQSPVGQAIAKLDSR